MRKMLLFLGVFCLIVFCIFYYKTLKNGNNINSKSEKEFIDYILNDMKEYKANADVKIISNKTEKDYKIYQEVTNSKSTQKVLNEKDEDIIEIVLENNKLKIVNQILNLEKVYEEYSTLLNNSLFLNVFLNEYKNEENNHKVYEENGDIILEIELVKNINTYARFKRLHISKDTKSIKELIVLDDNQKIRACIKYNNIEIK